MRMVLLIGAGFFLISFLRAAPPDFDREVAAVLVNRCVECHSGTEPAGELNLTQKNRVLGKDAVVVAGKLDQSVLWKKVESGEMPPKAKLTVAEKSIIKSWIEGGANWGTDPIDPFARSTDKRAGRDWWSLQPIKRPQVPGTGNPIDVFIRRNLTAKGMTPAPPADRRTLIRRVYFDLIGLPPDYESVEAFVTDRSPDAYARLVDKLLASPQYGERWGRYWLDVARFAETSGYERDQTKPNAWKYRDWVIKSFNDDLPFDRFLTEQLAGDELPEKNLIATGFIRLGTWNDEPNDPNEYKYNRLEDMVHATSTAFLGMTIKCARCHDHKFDPIRQTDYYRMASVFWSGFIEPGPREWLGGPDPKVISNDGVFGWIDRGREVPPLKLLKKGDPNRPSDVVAPAPPSFLVSLDRPFAATSKDAKTTGRRLALAKWMTDPNNPLPARVWVNRIWQQHFGFGLVRTSDNFGFNGDKPTNPELLDWLASEFQAGNGQSKRIHRLILLSETYRQSSQHPKQNEYDAIDAANRWQWRAERRRLDSEALRDSLLAVSGQLKLTPAGGPSFYPEISPDALEGLSTKSAAWKASPASEQGRRSVYIFAKRGLLSPFLTTFDFPDTTGPTCQRDVTTVPTQSLALLNNRFVHEQSQAMSKKIEGKDMKEKIRHAWKLGLGRLPRESEMREAEKHLSVQEKNFTGRPNAAQDALASLCHVLLNTNEFLYVD